MPDSFVTWEEKRNNFTFDKKKRNMVKEKAKKVLGQRRPYFRILSEF